MDWSKIGLIAIGCFVLWQTYNLYRKGGIRAMMNESRNAPQHWGTYIFLMVMLIIFVILLIKL